jgi:hypothetical protein
MNKADRKANLARSRATARGQIPMLVGEPSDVPGFQAWMVGKVMVLMPRLLPGTPSTIRRRYRDRIIANATGECPRCQTIAADPGTGKVLDNAAMAHEHDCPVSLVEDEAERWIDPRSREMRQAMVWNRG